ncbi:MAG: hypothetical protein RR951_11340, partial [Ruthenibacterium sp.]
GRILGEKTNAWSFQTCPRRYQPIFCASGRDAPALPEAGSGGERRQTKTGRKNEQFTKFLDPIAGRFYMPAIDDAQEQCEITLL